jgi:hypothetical protein
MDTTDAAPTVGILACLAVLLALGAPYVLLTDPGTGLDVYYSDGPLGIGAVAFLAVLLVIVFLSGKQERSDPDTIAGVALVGGLATLGFALLWALSVDQTNVFSFSADWMGYHRWIVVGASAMIPASAGVYARAVLS